MGTTAQQFCLKWNNHQANMLSVFDRLLSTKSLVDVTISCEGRNVKAHKVVLSACSPFFENLFIENPCKHPIVILKDIRYADLKALVEFMYKGEVNVVQEQLPTLLKTAETLKIKGLAEVTGDSSGSSKSAEDKPHASVTPRPESPSTRRKRQRVRRKSTDSAAGHSDSEESVPKASRTEHDDSSMDGATSLDDGSQASLHQQQQASSASGGQSQQAQQQSKEPSNVQSTAVTVNSSSSSANQANNAASSAANANSSTANGPNSSSKDADFEPTRLLEASMTTDHGADNSTDLNNSTGPDNTLIPDGLDIKPIITLEEGGATPAGSIVPATAAPSLQTGTDAISSLFPQATGAAALPGTSFQASPQSHGGAIESSTVFCSADLELALDPSPSLLLVSHSSRSAHHSHSQTARNLNHHNHPSRHHAGHHLPRVSSSSSFAPSVSLPDAPASYPAVGLPSLSHSTGSQMFGSSVQQRAPSSYTHSSASSPDAQQTSFSSASAHPDGRLVPESQHTHHTSSSLSSSQSISNVCLSSLVGATPTSDEIVCCSTSPSMSLDAPAMAPSSSSSASSPMVLTSTMPSHAASHVVKLDMAALQPPPPPPPSLTLAHDAASDVNCGGRNGGAYTSSDLEMVAARNNGARSGNRAGVDDDDDGADSAPNAAAVAAAAVAAALVHQHHSGSGSDAQSSRAGAVEAAAAGGYCAQSTATTGPPMAGALSGGTAVAAVHYAGAGSGADGASGCLVYPNQTGGGPASSRRFQSSIGGNSGVTGNVSASASGRGSNGGNSGNVRRFPCTYCNYSSVFRSNLEKHVRKHTGDKPFQCVFGGCMFRTANKSNLNQHHRAVHGVISTNSRRSCDNGADRIRALGGSSCSYSGGSKRKRSGVAAAAAAAGTGAIASEVGAVIDTVAAPLVLSLTSGSPESVAVANQAAAASAV